MIKLWNRGLLMRTISCWIAAGLLAASNFAVAQEPQDNPPPPEPQSQNQDPGWRRASDPPPQAQANEPINLPSQLTLKPGTFVTVRVDQWLSSDRNQPGDAFSASLVQPLVIDGIVVAQRGQTIGGRVAETKKAGRIEGTSRLGIELTDLTLVDGQVIPIKSQLINRNGSTSQGRDAAAIAGTTGVGAAIGAAAGWGTGAAIGAGAGAAAGVLGVLLTRGHETVIGPESVLTFRVDDPVTISTDRAPQAFRVVQPNDYSQPQQPRLQARRPPPPQSYYGYGYPYPYYYPYYYGPGFYGPTIFFGGHFHRGFRR
jgi:hypothetical protein